MKILMVTPALNLCGGIESYAMNYYRNMSKNIHMDFATHDIKDENYKKELLLWAIPLIVITIATFINPFTSTNNCRMVTSSKIRTYFRKRFRS